MKLTKILLCRIKLWIEDLTFVDDRFLLAEVRERWEVLDAILLGQAFVVDLDKVHPKVIRIVVDLLQLGQHLVTCRATSRI